MALATTEPAIVSKSVFAEMCRVSKGRVSQWLAAGQIFGDALVGTGPTAQIRVDVARAQLKRNLDVVQSTGANGLTTQLGNVPKNGGDADAAIATDNTVEERIKHERLEGLALANAKARVEGAARDGRYVEAEDARQQLGRVAARLMSVFEASLSEFASAVVAKPPASSREAAHLLRGVWRDIRVRQANLAGSEAATIMALVDDEAGR